MAIVPIGGNAGAPMTWADWHDIDPTNITEVVEGAVYIINDDVEFGDITTPTYFTSKDQEMVYFTDGHAFTIKDNATLQLGVLYGSYGIQGSFWNISPSAHLDIITTGDSNATILVYDSYIHSRAAYIIYFKEGIFTAINSTFSAEYYTTDTNYNRWFFWTGSVTINMIKCYLHNMTNMLLEVTPNTFEDVHIHRTVNVIKVQTSITAKGLTGTSIGSKDIYNQGAGVEANILDPNFNISNPVITAADGIIREQYTFNIHVKDKDGVNLGTVTCLLEDTNGDTVFSVNTAGTGKIAEQTVDYKKWTGTSETLAEYSPHKLTMSKANYETLVKDEITVDKAKDLEFELLPALAVGDVRDGTSFGESKEGTLDLPAVGDVEKGVKFDNTTKTGTFKEPGIANVAEGIQYGEDDTEFTGTFVRNAVTGAIVVGQATVGTVIGE